MDKAKLLELRKKKLDNKAKNQQEILDSNASIVQAIQNLHKVINDTAEYNQSELVKQIGQLRASESHQPLIDKLDELLLNTDNNVEVTNLESLIEAVDKIKLDNNEVVLAINNVVTEIENNKQSQEPEDYIPVRSVRKVGNILVFDDSPNQSIVNGGGGGSSFPLRLIRGDSLSVVNPDGTYIGGSPQIKAALTEKIDVVDVNNTYIGQAEPGTAISAGTWRIKKIIIAGALTTIAWADGVGTFTKVWDDRASYTYS